MPSLLFQTLHKIKEALLLSKAVKINLFRFEIIIVVQRQYCNEICQTKDSY